MDYENLKYKTIKDVSNLIQKGRICPEELTRFYLEKISTDPKSKDVFTEVLKNSAIDSARESKKRNKTGMRKGVLDGIPISVKDLADIRGHLTRGGSSLTNTKKAKKNAVFVDKLYSEGVVLLGKTHMTELAFSGLGLNPTTATPPNPFNERLVSGGSSSGSAVSVSRNYCLASIGSDTGGSVRIPAAWNNLVGLKTTHNIIDLTGVLRLCPSFDTLGPICRSVEDTHFLFNAMTNGNFKRPRKLKPEKLKFLIIKNMFFEDIDSDINNSFNIAIEKIIQRGATVEYKSLPEIDTAFEISKTVFPAEAYGIWQHAIEKNPEKMFVPIRERFRSGREIAAHNYIFSLYKLFDLRMSFLQKVLGFDAILAPTSPIKPPCISRLLDNHDFFTEKNLMALRNTRIANSLNLCALTLPTKTNFSGLMLMGRPNSEIELMCVGLSIEKIK
ncbi:amidase [Paracoccaceae bacterium]|nr:amidase [Paracoccaceae bacterium]